MTKRGMRRLAMLATAALIGAAALATAYVVRQSMNAKKIETARDQGLMLYESEEYEAALPYLGTAVARLRDDPEVLVAYAECRYSVPMPNFQHVGRAIAAAKAALVIEPENTKTQQVLLNLYGESGYLTELIELSGRVIQGDPTLYEPRIQRIDALNLLSRRDEALEEAQLLIEAFPNDLFAHMKHSEMALRAGVEVEEIAVGAIQLRDRFADNPQYFAWSAGLDRITGEYERASESVRTAAALPPVSASQIGELIDLIRQLDSDINRLQIDDTDGPRPLLVLADELFTKTLDDPTMGRAFAAEATRRAWWMNQTERAIGFAQRIGTPRDADPGLPIWWAAIALMSENPDMTAAPEAAFDIGAYIASIAETDWGVVLAGMEALRQGKNETVVRLLDGLVFEDGETRAVASYVKGMAMYRMGDSRGALLALRSAAESGDIKRDIAWNALGAAYTASGELYEADQAYRHMTTRSTLPGLDRLDAVLNGAERNGDTRLARDGLNRIIELGEAASPDDATYQVRLSRALVLAGELQRGLDIAEDLLESGQQPDPLGTIYLIHTLRTYAPQLSEDLLASITERTDSIEVLAYRASELGHAGRLDEGIALLRAQIAEREDSEAFSYRRALVRVLDGFDTEDATSEARKLSDEYPQSATAQLAALGTKALWKDHEGARLAVTRLKESVGDHSIVWQTFDARATLADNPSDEEINAAIIRLKDVTEQNPSDFDALMLTARANRLIAERRAAEDPEANVSTYIDRASSFYARAAGNGARAVAFKPHIEMLREAGEITESERVLDRFAAIEFLPHSKPENLYQGQLIERLTLFVESGRWADAARDQSWLIDPENPQTELYLAQLLQRAGDDSSAARVVEVFLAREDRDPAFVEDCAVILADSGYIERSIEVYRSLPDEPGVASPEKKIANMLMRIGQPAQALPIQLDIARQQDGIEEWITAIRIAIAAGNSQTVESTLQEARAANPDAPEIEAFAGGTTMRSASLALAVALPEGASEGLKALRDLASGHGRGEFDDDTMLAKLSALNTQYPDVYEAWSLRVQSHAMIGDIEGAVDAARLAAEAMPSSTRAVRQYTEALRSVGMLDEALPYAEELVRLSRPDVYEAQMILAMIEAGRGEYQRAINLLTPFRSRLEQDSGVTPSPGFSTLAVAFAGIGKPVEAQAIFLTRAQSGGPAWQRIAVIAAFSLPDEYVENGRAWIELANDPSLAAPRANALLRLARFSGDPADATKAMSLYQQFGIADGAPKSTDWLWVAARAAKLSGDQDQAEALHRDLLRTEPDELAVVVSLADILSRQPAKADDALALIASNMSQGETAGLEQYETAFAIAKARAHLTAGRPNESVQILDPIVASDTPPASAVTLLARACLQLGNQDRATSLVDQVSESAGLDAQTADEIRAVLTELQP